MQRQNSGKQRTRGDSTVSRLRISLLIDPNLCLNVVRLKKARLWRGARAVPVGKRWCVRKVCVWV